MSQYLLSANLGESDFVVTSIAIISQNNPGYAAGKYELALRKCLVDKYYSNLSHVWLFPLFEMKVRTT